MVWNNLGLAQRGQGDVRAVLSQYAAAEQDYAQAIASAQHALVLAPEDVTVWINLGVAQHRLGNLLEARSQLPQAQQGYAQAVDSFQHALALAPQNVLAMNTLGQVQQQQADLLMALSQHAMAAPIYAEAVENYRRALAMAPGYVQVWNNLGVTQQRRAELHLALLPHAHAQIQALQDYAAAIDSYRRALALAPDNAVTWMNLGYVQAQHADLMADQGHADESQSLFEAALEASTRARSLAPANVNVLRRQASIALIQARRAQGLEGPARRQALLGEARQHMNDWRALAPDDARIEPMEVQWLALCDQ